MISGVAMKRGDSYPSGNPIAPVGIVAPRNSDAAAAFGEPMRPKRPPSRWWYLIAAVLAVGGIAGGIAWFVHGFTSLDDDIEALQRIPVPGARTVTLREGAQSVYFESRDGEDAPVPQLSIRIAPAGGGRALALRDHDGSVTYSIGGHDGQSVYGFDSPRAGRYRVKVSTNTELLPTEPVVAMGEGIGGRIVSTVLAGLAFIFGGLLASGGWIILVAIRRRRAGA
jgi:hypothetical protein